MSTTSARRAMSSTSPTASAATTSCRRAWPWWHRRASSHRRGAMRGSRDVKAARDREPAEVVARELVPSVIRIAVKAGAEGRLFGSVTAADVVEAVHAQAGVELDRRRLHLAEPIKSLGTHEVPVKLHADVEFQITVEVVAQGR